MRTRLLVAFFVLVAATSMTACKRNKDKVVQRCWTNDKVLLFGSVGATAECKDQFTDNDSCGGVQKRSKDPCPRANLVAGCKTEDEIHWFYNEGFAGAASPPLVRQEGTVSFDLQK